MAMSPKIGQNLQPFTGNSAWRLYVCERFYVVCKHLIVCMSWSLRLNTVWNLLKLKNTHVTHDDNYVDEEDPDASIYDQVIQFSSMM